MQRDAQDTATTTSRYGYTGTGDSQDLELSTGNKITHLPGHGINCAARRLSTTVAGSSLGAALLGGAVGCCPNCRMGKRRGKRQGKGRGTGLQQPRRWTGAA